MKSLQAGLLFSSLQEAYHRYTVGIYSELQCRRAVQTHHLEAVADGRRSTIELTVRATSSFTGLAAREIILISLTTTINKVLTEPFHMIIVPHSRGVQTRAPLAWKMTYSWLKGIDKYNDTRLACHYQYADTNKRICSQ